MRLDSARLSRPAPTNCLQRCRSPSLEKPRINSKPRLTTFQLRSLFGRPQATSKPRAVAIPNLDSSSSSGWTAAKTCQFRATNTRAASKNSSNAWLQRPPLPKRRPRATTSRHQSKLTVRCARRRQSTCDEHALSLANKYFGNASAEWSEILKAQILAILRRFHLRLVH